MRQKSSLGSQNFWTPSLLIGERRKTLTALNKFKFKIMSILKTN